MTRTPFASSHLRSSLPLSLLAVLALALMIPAIAAPPMAHDSFWIDRVWIDQFVAQLRAGNPYPRWLPWSHGGLGAPVFYYYAPLAFYWAASFGLLGLGTYAALLAAAGAAWLGSGVAMWWWLRGRGGHALLGAALYMALPYHVIDFYRRGALAEFCAYAILPLLAIAVRRAAAGRGAGGLALAYAALVMTHLPTALLASVLLIAPWGGWLVWRDRRSAGPLAFGLGMGLLLAAIYLVPALTLQHHVSIDKLWGTAGFHASSWSFFAPSRWAAPASAWLIVGLTGLLAVTAGLFALKGDRWALWAIGGCAVVAGMVPGLWDVPILAKVQFPWRALLLVEFALATAVGRSRLGESLSILAVAPLLLLAAAFLDPHVADGSAPLGLADYPDVLEYLPSGASRETGSYSQWALALARRQPAVAHDGDRTILARFYFPAWQVRCGGVAVATVPDPATNLLSFRGADCDVALAALPAERIGAAASLAALLVLVALTFRRRQAVRKSAPERGPEALP